jgi:hypothetical protein
MRTPFKMLIDAHLNVLTTPGRTISVPLRVVNEGTHSLHVAATARWGFPGWRVLVTPARFTLRPGHTATEHLAVTIPKSAAGSYRLSVEFAAAPLAHDGGIRTAGALADTIVVRLPLAVAPHAGGSPWLLAAGVGLGLALLALGAIVAVRHRGRMSTRKVGTVQNLNTKPPLVSYRGDSISLRPTHPDREAVEHGRHAR